MTDVIDRGCEREEMDRELALKQRKPELPFVGACHNCSEPLRAGVFCCRECGEDYEKRERFNWGM